MPATDPDPADLSPDERTRAVAALLAAGLLRLRDRPLPAEPPPEPSREESSDTRTNPLAVSPEKSVTVHAG